MRHAGVVLLAATLAVSTSCSERPLGFLARSHAASVTAVPVPPDPRVGAIFSGDQSVHTCTGSVLHSATGDLVITAAHCLADGLDGSFVPAFAKEAQPQDFWHVDNVYLDPRWVSAQDPLADFAIIRVSRGGGPSLETVVGQGFALGTSPRDGTVVDVVGYATGEGGDPIGCSARMTAAERGYPAVRCAGLVDGTSGGPWLTGTTVVGVTGGLEGGGCQPDVSYAPPFGDAVQQLVARAEARGPGDRAPTDVEVVC